MSLFKQKTEPKQFIIKDKPVVCGHCGNDTFHVHYSRQNFAGDMFPAPTDCYVCASCAHIEWFIAEMENE